MRTSCENVGTVFLFFLRLFSRISLELAALRAHNFSDSRLAHKNSARAHHDAERFTANPERPARDSAHNPRDSYQLSVSNRRGLLGFSGLAPHSGRSSVPFHRSCSGTEEFLPTSHPPTACYRDGRTTRVKLPLTNNRV